MNIKRLESGGIITNYNCSSSFLHCLYNSSPSRSSDYINKETAVSNIQKIVSLGCRSIHVGGGEPFLNRRGLIGFLETARQEGIGIEYIETNSSWCIDQESSTSFLRDVKDLGVNTLLVSMSPFHNAHIPFVKVKRLLECCRKAGISVFPWVAGFMPDIERFDINKVHTFDEYEAEFGPDYLKEVLSRYWISAGGRALSLLEKVSGKIPAEEIIGKSCGCRELENVSHFHLDLYGNYIPGLCAGLSVRTEDLGKELSFEKYPVLTLLNENGPGALARYASREYGFTPELSYNSKCHLCRDIRRFLVAEKKSGFPELSPSEYYITD
ncbi:MAG: radical SAM protein [Fibrobacterota bacterium]